MPEIITLEELNKLEIITSEELLKRREIEEWEYKSPLFYDKTVIKFDSLKKAIRFGVDFVHNYLIPKYGGEEASKFPLAKSEPFREDGGELLAEMLGAKKPNPDQETWYVIPTDRFNEVQEYISQKNKIS